MSSSSTVVGKPLPAPPAVMPATAGLGIIATLPACNPPAPLMPVALMPAPDWTPDCAAAGCAPGADPAAPTFIATGSPVPDPEQPTTIVDADATYAKHAAFHI